MRGSFSTTGIDPTLPLVVQRPWIVVTLIHDMPLSEEVAPDYDDNTENFRERDYKLDLELKKLR